MKTNYFNPGIYFFVIAQLFTLHHTARGQVRVSGRHNSNRRKETEGYASFVCNTGLLFANNVPGNLSVSFPYTRTSAGNSPAFFGNYNQNITNTFPRNFAMYDVLHLTFGHNNFIYDFGFGGIGRGSAASSNFSGNEGFMLNGGFGYSIPLGRPDKEYHQPLLIKGTLSISYTQFSVDMNSDNTIDSRNSTVSMLGLSSTPSFSYTTGGKHPVTHYANTNYVDLTLREGFTSLTPRISICENPLTHKFHFGVDLGYSIPIGHKEELNFGQKGLSGGYKNIGQVGLGTSGLTVLYNNKRVTELPVKFGGIYVGISVGANIYSSEREKNKCPNKMISPIN